MKPIDLLVIGIIAVLVIVSVITLINNKKKGKSSCGCDCAHCSGCSSKPKATDDTEK